jgi:hypothetical protein
VPAGGAVVRGSVPEMARGSHRSENAEAGWVSMCDLLLLLFAVGLLIAGALAVSSQLQQRARMSGEAQLGIAQDLLAKTRAELLDWQIVAEGLERESEEFREAGVTQAATAKQAAERIEALVEQLHAAESSSADAEARVDALKRRLEEMTSMEASSRQALGDADRARLAAEIATKEADAAAVETRAALAQAQEQLEAASARLAFAEASAEKALAEASSRSAETEAAVERYREIDSERRNLATELDAQKGIRQEILGIPGSLRNVVFVVDRSQSMNKGGRWSDAKRTVEAWIRHLPVERAALVVFNSDAIVVPERLEMDGEQGEWKLPPIDQRSRDSMIAELDRLEPVGLTLTQRAMRTAMTFSDADAIILFTDGAPEQVAGAVMDPAAEVFSLVSNWKASNPSGRVHTVGIGDYFDVRMRDFLLGVAERGDGAFIGR